MKKDLTGKTAAELVTMPKGRTALRAYVCQAANHSLRIELIDGAAPPSLAGSPAYWTTPGGRPVYHPRAYARLGRVIYHPTTETVEVGRDWQYKAPEWSQSC